MKNLIAEQQKLIEALTKMNEAYEAEIRMYRSKAAWQEAAREAPQATVALLESDDCPPLPPGWEFRGVDPVRTDGQEPATSDEPPNILIEAAKARGLT